MTADSQGNCNKGPDIDSLKKSQMQQGLKIDQILESQRTTAAELKQAIDGLTAIIKSDIETRKDVEQLKKDREDLFALIRTGEQRLGKIEHRNAICDGAGVLERFPKVWDWYMKHDTASQNIDNLICSIKKKVDKVYNWHLGELGWRRFIPAMMTFLCAAIVVYEKFIK